MGDFVETFKRLGVTLLGVGLVALNKKLGLGFSDEALLGIASMAVAYVVSGSYKAAVVEKAKQEGTSAAASVKDLKDVMDALKGMGFKNPGAQ
jgi:hypothetical protein